MKQEQPKEDYSLLTDEQLSERYWGLDSTVRNHPIIKEMQLRGLLEGKYTPPSDGTFKSTTSL